MKENREEQLRRNATVGENHGHTHTRKSILRRGRERKKRGGIKG